MFQNKWFKTNKINALVPPEIQLYLKELTLNLPVEVDYLQVFKIKPSSTTNNAMIISHSQEEPFYEKEHVFVGATCDPQTIFVVDEVDAATMMLSEEY